MKRKISKALALSLVALTLALTLCGVMASAAFGSGVRAVATEVSMIKTGLLGKRLAFSDADFKSALCLADFDSITVTKIPSSTEGTLLLSGRRVGEGKIIKRKSLGALSFIPATESVTECRFSFTVDGGSGEEIECILKFIDKVNYAPKAEGDTSAAALKTQENITLHGRMYGTDPEGDGLYFMVVAYPEYGVLTVTDDAEGRYCYSPGEGFTGTDEFTYVVRDEYGNYSHPETVSIKVTDRMCDTVYRDMEDRAEYNAAVTMTAMSVMGGRIIGDGSYFMPDDTVSRAEFVAMAMKSAGIRADSTLVSTYFDDDEDIPEGLKCYIATAQRTGIINGDFKDGKLIFSPNEEITKYEAAKIMATILGADGEGEETVYATDESVPVWARACVSAMCMLGIFEGEEGLNPTGSVTRADAASYLYKMLDVV
ncbi:MAG: S-layer homology domain-containing protein [Clostridia bacterium]|nr:S-layer homology domain-containing protein [Clostridia bacterium]